MQPLFKISAGTRGFSLIELLIAVSVTAFLSVGIFSVFSQGLKVWKRAVAVKPEVNADIVFDKIAGDLRNSLIARGQALEGQDTRMVFWSYGASVPDGLSAPRLITYEYAGGEKKLKKSEESLQMLLDPDYAADERGFREVLAGLKECRFEFYHQSKDGSLYQWKPFWKNKCMPKAIRISLKYDDEHSVGNYTKIVSLPAQSTCNVG